MKVWPYCSPHRHGVRPEAKPFFVPGCPTCERKKAAGIVTGDEPRPPRIQRMQWTKTRRRMTA